MSHENPNSNTRPQEKLPYGVETGAEQPYREFDNTPLYEANEQGLIGETPNDVSMITPAEGIPAVPPQPPHLPEYTAPTGDGENKPEKKKKTGIKVAAGLGVAALVGAGAAIFAPKVFGGEEEAPQAGTDPVATGEANPGEQESESADTTGSELSKDPEGVPETDKLPKNADGIPVNRLTKEQLADYVTIDAKRYNTPKSILERFQDAQNAWVNAGNNQELVDDYMGYLDGNDSGSRYKEISHNHAATYDRVVEKRLLASDWREDQELKTYVDSITDVHGTTATSYMLSGTGLRFYDMERYYRVLEYDLRSMEVLENSDDRIRVQASYVEHDNAENNEVDEDNNSAEGFNGTSTFTFVKQGDRWVIAGK